MAAASQGMRLVGVGSAVPKHVLTNGDLERLVDTNDEWISSRTGIRQRRILGKDESMTGLAALAAQRALEMAGVAPEDVDMILFCTSTPEDIFGGACLVRRGRGEDGGGHSYPIQRPRGRESLRPFSR